MIVKSISLTNFRNHLTYHLDCKKNTTLILGDNGWGKTSILEAIYILTRGKSFRATDPEILKHGADFYNIKLDYENGETISAAYDGKNKFFNIAGKKSKRLPKKNKYPVVLFLPQDLNLLSHAPSRRRDYFDTIFSTLDEKYSTLVSKYKKTLTQRAEILKTPDFSPSDLFSWDVLLARYGSEIAASRAKYLSKINELLPKTYHSIAENADILDIFYQSDAKTLSADTYLKKLQGNLERDHFLGHTTFGIHRDDFVFNFNHHPAATSASRGETRSIILSLKFIEAELFEQALGQKPLILLDDVFSELDPSRRLALVNNFKNHQVIITSVEDLSK